MSGRSVGSAVLASLLAVSCWIGLGFGQGVAQQPHPRQIISVSYEQLEIKEAVARFFKQVSGRYTLAEGVSGAVTAQLTNVSMESALANILRQVNATWRVKNGVYEIVLKPQPEPIDGTAYAEAERKQHGEDVRLTIWRIMKDVGVPYSVSPDLKGMVKVQDVDTKNLTFEAAISKRLSQLNATVRIEGGFWEIVPMASQDPGQKLVNVSFEGEDVREAIRKLFRGVDVPYSIAVEVQGTVSVDFKNTKLNDALTTMLSQVNATYQVEGGIYQIVLRKLKLWGPDPTDYSGKIITQEMMQGPVTMTQDNKFIYILRGEVLYKVNKSGLKTVAMGRLGQ